MNLVQLEKREDTTDLEKLDYDLELLTPNLAPREIKDWDRLKAYEQKSYEKAIPQEMAAYNAAKSLHAQVLHHNDYFSMRKFCGQRGLDLVFLLDGKTYYVECTNPKGTTTIGTKDMMEKVRRWVREDPEHKGIWVLAISHIGCLTWAIKYILRYLNIQVIITGYVQHSKNFEAVQGTILSQLKEGKNWFNMERQYDELMYGEAYKIAMNKRITKSNKQRDRIDKVTAQIRYMRTNKLASKETPNKIIAESNSILNSLIKESPKQGYSSKNKTTNGDNIDNMTDRISGKTLHVGNITIGMPSVLAHTYGFFPSLNSLKSWLMGSLG